VDGVDIQSIDCIYDWTADSTCISKAHQQDHVVLFFTIEIPSVRLAPFYRVMNTAVRFVAGLGSRDHTSDAHPELHWLVATNRTAYHIQAASL